MSIDPRAFVLRDAYEFAAFDEPYATSLVATGLERQSVIPADGTVMVFGADGAGKTTLLVDWAVHFAAGAPWLGLLEPTRPLTVAVLENEGVRAEFRRKLRGRLDAWDGPALDGRLRVFEQPWGEVTLNEELHRDELAHLINAHHVDLLVAGPLADLGVAGPGTPTDVSDFGLQLALLRADCDSPLAIVVAHHENRAGQMSGAWGRLPDTVAHVQPQGHRSLRIFWQKVRNANSLHKTITKLVWADGATFSLDEREPATNDRIRQEIEAFVLAHGDTSWGKVEVSGNDTQKRRVRDQLLAEGVIFDAGGSRGGMALWHPDDPAAPPRPTLDGVADVVSVRPEDGEHDRPRPSVLPVRKDGVEDGLLAPDYLLGLLALDATGARVGELAAATVGDLDENRGAWLVRAKVCKTRRARWVALPDDLFHAVVDRLPAREDRDPEAPLFAIGSTDRLRMAISRACRDAGVPVFSPHDLRHRRISLWNDHDDNGDRPGHSWPEIGKRVGQRNIATTADTYSHVLMDYREIDRSELLKRVRTTHPRLHTPEAETVSFAATF